MTLSELKDITEAVKNGIEAIAVLGAGIWAAYTFGSLRQIAKAQADIANTEAVRRKTEAELQQLNERARVGAVIEIDIASSSCILPGTTDHALSVLVEITNKGNRNAQIEYPESPFTVYGVTADANRKLSYVPLSKASVMSSIDPTKRSLKLLVRAGGKERIPFFVTGLQPGLYLLIITLPLSPAEQEIAKDYGFVGSGRWSGKRYVVIPTPPPAA